MHSAHTRLRPLYLIGAVLLAGCQSQQQTAQRPPDKIEPLRPLNVVVVTVDTLRPDHLGCYGYPDIETPALDGLAKRGVLFENAVVQTPLTPPSHASIFTGQNPNMHKVRNTGGFVLPSSSHPLARILQEQGWDTAAFIGSAVLKKLFGFNNGFAVYDDEMPRPGSRNEFREDPERKASAVVDRAIAWLDKKPAGLDSYALHVLRIQFVGDLVRSEIWQVFDKDVFTSQRSLAAAVSSADDYERRLIH